MNQIIYSKNLENPLFNQNKKPKTKYKIIFYISVISLVGFIIYYLILYYNISKKGNFSKHILSTYDIQALYSTNNYIEPNIVLENGESVDIIGVLEIEKINLRYPILAEFSDELLKIAPCKFYGDSLDKTGNICIAGHNYDNNEFFSNLFLLEIGDIINVYNLNGVLSSYTIYSKFETSPDDTSCINQDTLFQEITLITCNNSNKNRLIIKAKK